MKQGIERLDYPIRHNKKILTKIIERDLKSNSTKDITNFIWDFFTDFLYDSTESYHSSELYHTKKERDEFIAEHRGDFIYRKSVFQTKTTNPFR